MARLAQFIICFAALSLTVVQSAFKANAYKGTCQDNLLAGSVPSYCNNNLSFAERARSLVENLTLEERVGLFFGYPSSPFVERLNLKQWSLDHTCIHGINKARNVTVFPHAIAQASTWDLSLVAKIGRAVAKEARVLSHVGYVTTNGRNQGSYLSCDGGPLANTAHDPRWGRIAETYGEDPHLVQELGVAALSSMQNQIPVSFPNGSMSTKDFFFETRQVTRHFLGYHVAKPDNLYPVFNVTKKALADSYFPVFQAFQQKGRADGIMCAMTMIRIEDEPPFPPCASSYLNDEILRKTWHSDALVQTDCCDSVSTINEPFHYMNISSDKEALAIAVLKGNLQNYYGFKVELMRKNLQELAMASKEILLKVKLSAERVLLSFFRLGFFDSHRDSYPFRTNSYNNRLVGGKGHASLARKSAHAAIVLLRNDQSILPSTLKGLPSSQLAVIGPFSNCSECHLHSYHGIPKRVSTILQATQALFASDKQNVPYEQGANISCPVDRPRCWLDENSFERAALARAVGVAQQAKITILCLGLGNKIEAEGTDRTTMRLPAVQEELLRRVSTTGTRVIMVLISGSGVDVDESLAHGVLWAPYLGQEAGSAILDVIQGHQEPSGKLPLTFYTEKWMRDTRSSIQNLNLDEDLGRTYRFIRHPRYVKHSFGYGLSYSSWSYSNFSCVTTGDEVNCTVKLKNLGSRPGYQITQLYLQLPIPHLSVTDGYKYQYSLVAFKKEYVQALTAVAVSMRVPMNSFSAPTETGGRERLGGEVTLVVGGRLPTDLEAVKEVGDCQVYTLQVESNRPIEEVYYI